MGVLSVATLRVVALLHTEAMLQQEAPPLVEVHLRIARHAIAMMTARTGVDAFYINWQVVTGSFLLTVGVPAEAPLKPASANAELLLLNGSIAETLASDPVFRRPRSLSHAAVFGSSKSDPAVLLLAAEQKFRAALKLDPQLLEARVRLGRVLGLQGRDDAARDELDRVRREAGSGCEAYLAALILGSLHERASRFAEASEAYRAAIREYPESQTAYIALAHVRERQADRDGAWDTIRTMLQPQAKRQDPWWLYSYAQYWQTDKRLARLRTMIRQ